MSGQKKTTEKLVAANKKISAEIISIFALIIAAGSLTWQIMDYSSTHWTPKYNLDGEYISTDGCGLTFVKQHNKLFSASCASGSHAHLLEGEYVDSVTVKLTVTRIGLTEECQGVTDKRAASITVSSSDNFTLVQPSWISACRGSRNAKVNELVFGRPEAQTSKSDEKRF